ncbi:MAG: hypothetical protein ACRDFB_09250 [Rhabdochlamydiaceae bacterium]
MKTLQISIITGLSISFLILGTGSAFASVELNTYLPIDGHPVTPIFKFSKTITIDYPNESKLKTDLAGRNVTVTFTDDSDNNPTIKSLMEQINHNIATQGSTTTTITHLTVQYSSVIYGDNKQATINYLVTLKPTLSNYVLKSGSDNVPTILDLSWMGFNMKDPIMITTKQYGNLEINFPLGVIQNQLPYSYDILKEIPQDDFVKSNLMDSSPLDGYPIDRWNTLYDPAYTLDDTAGDGYVGQKVAVTAFAYGENDPSYSPQSPIISSIDFMADSKYHITTLEKPNSGTIDVDGHANGYLIEGYPAISTSFLKIGYIGCVWCNPPDQTLFWSIAIMALVGSAVILFWIFYFRRFKES